MMPPYEYMNGTLITSDLSQVFVYLNLVTGGKFMPMMILFFFCVTFITSLLMQQRFTNTIKIETSLLASSFVCTGLTTLLLMNGLISWFWTAWCAGLFVLSLIWVVNTSPSQ